MIVTKSTRATARTRSASGCSVRSGRCSQRRRDVGQRGDGAGDRQRAIARRRLGPFARDEHGDQRAGGDGDGDDGELEDQQAPGEAPHPHRRMIPRDHNDTFDHNDHKRDRRPGRP